MLTGPNHEPPLQVQQNAIEVLGGGSNFWCLSFISVLSDSGSRLSQTEKHAFCWTGFVEMTLPASVESLGEKCFHVCGLLSSVTFESESKFDYAHSAGEGETVSECEGRRLRLQMNVSAESRRADEEGY
jgi:hypothetical protein